MRPSTESHFPIFLCSLLLPALLGKAADFSLGHVQLDAGSGFSVQVPFQADSYYILYRGESPSTITNAVDIQTRAYGVGAGVSGPP